ncbi:MAG TPA: hypothetical protein VK066_07075 [Chloroflexota bacterium]|nr:hypothetical protein [Chloroflexota bacterium]
MKLSSPAARAAFAAAGVHVLAAGAMLVALEPGLPVAGSALAARMAHVSERTAVWWLGWLVWHAADFALLAFYVALAARWGRWAPIRCRLALLLAGAGLADDLGAQVVYMAVAPRLGPEAFVVAEAVAGVLTGYVANGLYTVAGLLLVWAGARELPCYLVALSLPVWAAGFGLSAASLVGSPDGQFWSVAVLMPAFIGWTLLMGRWLSARAS